VETIDSHRPPLSICLIRHGLSTANVDEKVYLQMPDHVIPLVNPRDDPILLEAGRSLASLGMPPHDTVAWYICAFPTGIIRNTLVRYSPYLRTKQTMDIVLAAAFGDQAHLVQKKESFLLREQEFGDWNTLTEAEMEKENPRRFIALKQAKDVYNKFYFRCPNSFLRCTFAASARARAPSNSSARCAPHTAPDTPTAKAALTSHSASRCSRQSFLEVRNNTTRIFSFLFVSRTPRYYPGSKQHHVVFLHGVTQRAMRMTFFNRTVEWFEREPNPSNGSVVHMKRNIDQSDGPRWSEYYLYNGVGQFHSPAATAPADVDSD
jgi:broad specificity phosphatase PhoE